jgi:hypothetical protein
VTEVAVALRVDAHIVVLRSDVTAEVNGIEIARHPDRCLFLANGDYGSAGKDLLHVAYLLSSGWWIVDSG